MATGSISRWLTPTRAMALGMLVLQVAWLFAVPPFRGSDEFDHVYKAAAVARGDWFSAPTDATRGTGAWLEVPADIVAAAGPQCEDLRYTSNADCRGTRHGNTVRIASGAGRYHPLFYWVVGTPALPFHGVAALYAMRLATLLLSWLLFCAAISAARTWARTPWPTAALAVAATPVLVYSSSVVAPNGVEMLAALAFWSALIGLTRDSLPRPPTRLLVTAAVAGTLLVTTRSFGPVWCLMAVITVLVATWNGPSRLRALARDRRVWAAGLVVVAATLQSSIYILVMGSLNVGTMSQSSFSLAHRFGMLLDDVLLWFLQSIAAFPLRNDGTQPAVYGCYLVIFVAVFSLGVRAAPPNLRRGIVLAFVLASLVPYLVVVATFNTYTEVWQGRYGVPYAVGIALLAGLALERDGAGRIGPRLRAAGLMLFVTAQVIGPVDVMRKCLGHPLSDASAWVHPPPAILAVIATVGAATLWWGASARVAKGPHSDQSGHSSPVAATSH